ncbi:MAG: multiple sugar transport system permease protein, partial [Thermomicrobiales bacterium]|nr:multiple sugar transport system permease protein [Thermomicrobiales bacterium]
MATMDYAGARRSRRATVAKNGLTYLALAIAGVIAAGPIVFLLATSVKETFTTSVDLSALWHPTFVNYHDVWFVHPFKKWMVNSLIVGTAVTVLILFVDSLAGYAFARKRFRGREGLFILLLSTLMIPLPVTLLPTFLLANRLNWIDTYQALILPGVAYPVGVFMMRQFIQTIPAELEDAARIDGMSDFGIYFRVILPLCVPGLAVLGLFTFMSQWGSFLWPLVISTSDHTRTIP